MYESYKFLFLTLIFIYVAMIKGIYWGWGLNGLKLVKKYKVFSKSRKT